MNLPRWQGRLLTNNDYFDKLKTIQNTKFSIKMFAVIKTGGKQYVVKPGDKVKIEKLENKEGEEITLSEVLLLEDNGKVQVGTPTVKGAEVSAKVLAQGKNDKVIVFKYKSKKRYARKIGHRQPFTQIEILELKS